MNDRPLNVLFVDDDNSLGSITARMLESKGYNCKHVQNISQAIDAVKKAFEAGEYYDIFLIDLVLENGETGIVALTQLGKIAPDTKAYLVSGHTGHKDYENCAEHGFDGKIEKPYTLKKLDDLIQQAMRLPH